MIRRLFPPLLASVSLLLPASAHAQSTVQVASPVGFAASNAARQAYCEARFTELPSGDAFREHLRIITANPHPAGSAKIGRAHV